MDSDPGIQQDRKKTQTLGIRLSKSRCSDLRGEQTWLLPAPHRLATDLAPHGHLQLGREEGNTCPSPTDWAP